MFDIGWQELFIIALVGVIVVGPKDLPHAIRTFARMIRKVRSMANEFQRGLDEVVRDAELDDIRKDFKSVSSMNIGKEIEKSIDPTGSLRQDLDMSDVQAELSSIGDKTEGKAPPSVSIEPSAEEAKPEKPKRVPRRRAKTAASLESPEAPVAISSAPAPNARKPRAAAKKATPAVKKTGVAGAGKPAVARKPRKPATKVSS